MFTKLRELLPANRLAALTGLVLAAIAFLVSIQTSLVPGSPAEEAIAKAILGLGSILGALKIVDKFLEGSQNWDSLIISGQPKNGSGLVNNTATAVADEEPAVDVDGPDQGAVPEGDYEVEETRGMPLGFEAKPPSENR